MPLRPKTIGKLFWTIGEAADELGVNPSAIRFWEREFGTITPKRTGKGDRLYTREQIDQLRAIQKLVKEEGFTIEGAKARLKRGMPDPEQASIDSEALLEKLLNIRRKLVELRLALRAQQ